MAHSDNFTIKMTLTEADVKPERVYISLNNEEVEEHIFKFKYWTEIMIKRAIIDDIKIFIEDVDTNTKSIHEVNFRYYKSRNVDASCNLQGHWRRDFVQRRSLRAGDEIGFYWNPDSNLLCFSVLNQAS